MMLNKHQQGFTLIEIILTVAILGVVASGVIIAINPSKMLAQSRDRVRLANLQSIRDALKLFYNTHNGKYPPGYVGDGVYGNGCVGGQYLYPTTDTTHCVSNALIAEGGLRSIPMTNVKNSLAPLQCRTHFYMQVAAGGATFGGIPAADMTNNSRYVLQFCLEGWTQAQRTSYMTSGLYNVGNGLSNEYPNCNWYSSAGVVQCFLYDWQKLPPLQP